MGSPGSVNFVRCLTCGEIIKGSRYDVAPLLAHIHNKHAEIDIVDTDTRRKRHFDNAPTTSTPKKFTKPEDTIEDYQQLDDAGNASEEEGKVSEGQHSQNQRDIDFAQHCAVSEVLAKYPEIKECEYTPHNPNAQVAYTRRYKLSTTPFPASVDLLQQPLQHTLYRTSLEQWSPANGTIYCPKCGSNKRPLLKTKAERFTHNKCGACCLLSCWPFCFVPWILPGQNQEYLYCANCKIFLGLYDRQRNCLKPNRLYVANGDRESRPSDDPKNAKVNWHQISKHQLLENESAPSEIAATDSAKPRSVSSITINGKELPPDTVARLEKYKRFGSMVGIDLNALTEAPPNSTQRQVAHKENETAAPSGAKNNLTA